MQVTEVVTTGGNLVGDAHLWLRTYLYCISECPGFDKRGERCRRETVDKWSVVEWWARLSSKI